jgi:glycosyl transferase family 25
MHIYVINLDGSTDRWNNISSQLNHLGLQYQRIAAVNGRSITLDGIVHYEKCHRQMGRDIQPGEVGCFLSHLKALRVFLETNDDFAVILEDDARLHDTFKDDLKAIISELQKLGANLSSLVNLAPSDYKYSSVYRSLEGCTLHRTHRFPMMAMGVIWSRAAARKVLDSALPITMPFDNFLRHTFTGGNAGFSAKPALMTQQGVPSDIAVGRSRSRANRSKWYFFIKIRRAWTEKVRATLSLVAWRLQVVARATTAWRSHT